MIAFHETLFALPDIIDMRTGLSLVSLLKFSDDRCIAPDGRNISARTQARSIIVSHSEKYEQERLSRWAMYSRSGSMETRICEWMNEINRIHYRWSIESSIHFGAKPCEWWGMRNERKNAGGQNKKISASKTMEIPSIKKEWARALSEMSQIWLTAWSLISRSALDGNTPWWIMLVFTQSKTCWSPNNLIEHHSHEWVGCQRSKWSNTFTSKSISCALWENRSLLANNAEID